MRLSIQNFSCITNVQIEMNDLTVIIGEQASGKSITSKVYFFLREVVGNEVTNSITDETGYRGLVNSLKKEFSDLFPDYTWKNKPFQITLSSSTDSEIIKISNGDSTGRIKIKFSSPFKLEYSRLFSDFLQLKMERESRQQSDDADLSFNYDISSYKVFYDSLRKSNLNTMLEDVTYIPSGRSFFATIKENVFGFLSENIGIDPFLKNFGRYYEFSKQLSRLQSKENKDQLDHFDKVSESILKGRFSSEKKEDWIVSKAGKITVSHASSGQQEALPLLLVLKSILLHPGHTRSRCIVVEEPEAHLFPTSQKEIIDLLFYIKDARKEAKFLITTHSPYVLSCMNNGILKKPENISVNAYLIADGKSTPIIDNETSLIDGEGLDSVSEKIALEFYAAIEGQPK